MEPPGKEANLLKHTQRHIQLFVRGVLVSQINPLGLLLICSLICLPGTLLVYIYIYISTYNNNDNNKEAKFSPIFWYRNITLTGQGGCNRFPPASRSSTPPPSPAKPLHTSPEFPPPNHAYLAHIPLSHHRGSRCSRDGDGGTSSLPEI